MEINNISSMSTEELKDLTIKAAEEFYLNKDNGINIPDIVYDEMLFNIFRNLNLAGKTILHSRSNSWNS